MYNPRAFSFEQLAKSSEANKAVEELRKKLLGNSVA
jgi:hypothetical protein